ncbi:MAG: STAS domain-containing protein [Solirubrobacteraceae bacterium]
MSIARPLEIDESRAGEKGGLTLTGELDVATVPRLEEAVAALLGARVKHLTIDLRPLSFLDSSGLRAFIALHDRAQAEGWTLALIRPLGAALSIFQITRAEEKLPFVEVPS